MLEEGTKVLSHGIEYEVIQAVKGARGRYVVKDIGPRGPYYTVMKESTLVKLASLEGTAMGQINKQVVALEAQLEKLYAEERELMKPPRRKKSRGA